MAGLLGIDEALELVLARIVALDTEVVPIADASGRVLAETVRATVDLPPFDSSAMDGYAVRAADTPGRLALVEASAAGAPSTATLAAGQAAPISTGAVVPAGADAVVPVERTRADGEAAVEVEAVADGDNVRPRGGDTHAGDVVVGRGVRLGPWAVGAAAAVGVAELRCGRRPRVAVLATGSELRAPGEPLGPGQIYESNTLLLAAQLRETGALVEAAAPVEDDEQATRAAVERGLAADVLVTSGGVSVGQHDHVRAALAAGGVEEVFWQVAVKPGKPVAFGARGHTLVFGLPGNPVSSLVGFELFVRPALLALQGASDPGPAWQPGRLAAGVRRDRRTQLVRARRRFDAGGVLLEPLSGQESHMIARAASADALVLVEPGDGVLEAGAPVSYLAP
ncbi:MAG TPA: gephyrin-like molybdotransferase Glp [Gaiellaceae bacterium]|nr:gephyrin-like molybdotransferase Glp [Gaiellaceae bacterium]